MTINVQNACFLIFIQLSFVSHTFTFTHFVFLSFSIVLSGLSEVPKETRILDDR